MHHIIDRKLFMREMFIDRQIAKFSCFTVLAINFTLHSVFKYAFLLCAEEYLLEDVGSYQYLTNGQVPCPGQDDVEMYAQLQEAFEIMAITKDEQAAIHRTLSSILLLGNMQFKQERNSDQATLPDNTVAQKACHLMGLSVTELTKAFLKPRIKVGRDYVTKAQTKEQVGVH
jgi:myosin heavy subunit